MIINEIIKHGLINPGDISRIHESKRFVGVSKYIQNHCSDILKIYRETDNYLFRGWAGDKPSIFMGNPRIDRQPKDVAYNIQVGVDEKLKDAGFTALRSNSIFCTCERNHAGKYGAVYVIFPINGFNYTWALGLYDLYMKKYIVKGTLDFTPKQFVKQWNFKKRE